MRKRIIGTALALSLALVPMNVNAESDTQLLYATNIAPQTSVSLVGYAVSRNGVTLESDDSVATGDIIMKDGKQYTAIIHGDVNGDGKINSTDFMQIRRYYLGLYNMTASQLVAADANKDEKINSTDFMQVRKHFLKLFNICPNAADGIVYSDGETDIEVDHVTINNPIVDHEALGDFYGDPEINYFEGKYWIYATTSQADRKQTNMDVFWSEDLSTWTRTEDIINMEDFPQTTGCIWAPSVVKRGDWYYLSFSINDIQWDSTTAGLMMARSKSPAGPFEKYFEGPLIGRFIYGAQPIDGNFYEDDDGTLYFYYGGHANCNVAVMNEAMDGFIPFEEILDSDTQAEKDAKTFKSLTQSGDMGNYVEGSYMIKRDGKYYLMWSVGSYVDSTYSVEYGIGDSPFGPFEFQNKILETDLRIASGPGHHSCIYIEEYDTWLMVYHRRFPNAAHGTDRRLCIDKMEFDENGKILPIVMTDSWVLGGEKTDDDLINLAMIDGAEYSSSTADRTYTADMAFDDKVSSKSRWSQPGNAAAGQWLQIDFGSEQTYNCVNIYFEALGEGKFIYQKSDDGVNWTDITDTLTLTTAEKQQYLKQATRYFNEQTSRYLRVYFPNGSQWLSVYEMEVYFTDEPIFTPPAEKEPDTEDGFIESLATPSASFTKNAGMLEKLNDGIDSANNRWTEHTNPAAECAWIQYDFDSTVKITELQIKWFNDGSELLAPTAMTILYRKNGNLVEVTPTNEYTFPSNAYGIYKFEEIETDCIRIVPVRVEGTKKYVGINEWKVVGSVIE